MQKRMRNLYVALMGRGEKSRALRKAILTFLIRAFSAFFVYVSHIILARWLGAEDFGIYTYVWTWVVILGSFTTLGFSTLMVRELPTYFKRGRFKDFIGLMFYGRFYSGLLATAISALGILFIYLFQDVAHNPFMMPLILALVCVPLFALVDVQEGMCRANEWIYTGLLPNYLIRPFLVLLVSALILWLSGEINAVQVLYACIIASFVSAILQLIVIERKITRKIKSDENAKRSEKSHLFKPWMKLALPLLLTDSFLIIMASTDMIVLQQFMMPDDLGVYYAAVKTTLLVNFIYFAVVVASSNKFAEHWYDEDREKLTKSINHSVVMTFVPSFFASIAIIALGYWFLLAYGEDFTRGYSVIIILSVGAILKAATGPTEWMMTMMGQQKTVLFSLGTASILNIILNLILVPMMGLDGAAIATASTSAFSAIYLFLKVRGRLKIKIKFAGII